MVCSQADTTYWYTYLNTPSRSDILDFIVSQYEVLWREYESARKDVLKDGDIVEVR